LQRRGLATVLRYSQCLLSLVIAWFFFYVIGEILLTLPSSFHEATLWKSGWLD
jgi:hypothetical protein